MHFADLTFRNYPWEIVSNMIMHGNSDLCLPTYWSISSPINWRTHVQVKGWESAVPVHEKQANQVGFKILVLLQIKVGISMRVWHVLGEEREYWIWAWWISCVITLWLSEGHQLLCIFWYFFRESHAHDKVIRIWHLENSYSDSKL